MGTVAHGYMTAIFIPFVFPNGPTPPPVTSPGSRPGTTSTVVDFNPLDSVSDEAISLMKVLWRLQYCILEGLWYFKLYTPALVALETFVHIYITTYNHTVGLYFYPCTVHIFLHPKKSYTCSTMQRAIFTVNCVCLCCLCCLCCLGLCIYLPCNALYTYIYIYIRYSVRIVRGGGAYAGGTVSEI